MIRFSGNSRRKKDIFKKTQTVGMMASSPEIDTASASIALANYYSSAKGLKTVIAVTEEDDGFMHMLSGMKCIDVNPTGYCDGILTYYVLSDRDDLEKLMTKGSDMIVIDLGAGYERYTAEDFFLIERINAFVATAPWKYQKTREFLFTTVTKEKDLRQKFRNTVYSVRGTENDDARLEKEFQINVRSARDIMDISDPYRLKKEQLPIFQIYG